MKRKVGIILFAMLIVWGFLSKNKAYKQEEFESKIRQRQDVIRVLIKGNGFQGMTHASVKISAPSGVYMNGEKIQKEYEILAEDKAFKEGTIRIEAVQKTESVSIQSLQRACGVPSYEGVLELFCTAEGIVIVNEVEIESYLENVVPSEMPASYEMEALKAQAICARNYVYSHISSMAYPEYSANVDDSTSFQVYGNAERNERSSEAVKATEGCALWFEGEKALTYFYSTSCGKTASAEGTYPYLQSVEVKDEEGEDFEKTLPWYRWETSLSEEQLVQRLEQYNGNEIGELIEFKIERVEESGRVREIKAIGTAGEITVESEYRIRDALANADQEIFRQDGSSISGSELLPSAFFTIMKEAEGYKIRGGGYGHGLGMSQNAANEMAKAGWNCKEILEFFYPGTKVY